MKTKRVNPAGLYDGSPVGMSQATVDLESRFVFVSGQVDWDADSRVRHHTIEGQAEGAIEHLVTVLGESGATIEDVLELRVYVRGELEYGMPHIVPVFARHFGAIRPALTGIGVASLATPDTLIEIEALARLSRKET